MTSRRACSVVLSWAFALAGGSAWAQDPRPTEREVQAAALRAEMAELAARDGWKGVEADYVVLVDIAARGVRLTSDDHRLGARAAHDRGDIDLAIRRLSLALDAGADVEASALKDDLEARFAPVTLDAPDKPVLGYLERGGSKDAEAAVQHARALLAEKGAFTGWLPMGVYQLADERFTVDGVDLPLIVTTREALQRTIRQREGVVVDAGLGLVGMGGTSADGLQAAAATTFGLRLGAGWSTRLQDQLGVGGGLDLDLASEASPPALGALGQPPAATRLALATLHADVVLGAAPVQVAVGPAWTFGAAAARVSSGTGETDTPALRGRVGLLGAQATAALVSEDQPWAGTVSLRLQSDGDRAWLGVALGGRFHTYNGR